MPGVSYASRDSSEFCSPPAPPAYSANGSHMQGAFVYPPSHPSPIANNSFSITCPKFSYSPPERRAAATIKSSLKTSTRTAFRHSSMPSTGFSSSVSACSRPWPNIVSGRRSSTTSANSILCLGQFAGHSTSDGCGAAPGTPPRRKPDETELAEALSLPIQRYRQWDRVARAARTCSL